MPVSCRARFCIQPVVKLHLFVRPKIGEEKLIGIFFLFSYENNLKIRSSK